MPLDRAFLPYPVISSLIKGAQEEREERENERYPDCWRACSGGHEQGAGEQGLGLVLRRDGTGGCCSKWSLAICLYEPRSDRRLLPPRPSPLSLLPHFCPNQDMPSSISIILISSKAIKCSAYLKEKNNIATLKKFFYRVVGIWNEMIFWHKNYF